MPRPIHGLLILYLVFSLSSCKTVAPSPAQNSQETKETDEDVGEALKAVTGAISGKTLDQEDLKNLEKQIRADEEAQSAIRAITESVGGQAPVVKYCPVDGERYAPHIEICPAHNIKLETVEP